MSHNTFPEQQQPEPSRPIFGPAEMFPEDDTVRTYWVERTSGAEERWFHVGMQTASLNGETVQLAIMHGGPVQNPETGELQVLSKKIPLEKLLADNGAIERRRRQVEAAPYIGTAILDGSEPQSARETSAVHSPLKTPEKPGVPPLLRDVFKPEIRPEEVYEPFDYSHHFIMDDAEYEAAQARQIPRMEEQNRIRRAQAHYDQYVDAGTRRASVHVLAQTLQLNPDLDKVIEKYRDDLGLTDALSVVDALRMNEDLRLEAGMVLYAKLNRMVRERPEEYGRRIVTDGQKNPDHSPYPGKYPSGMTSRMYAARIALDKISGMYNGLLETTSDAIAYEGRHAINGQHRDAADRILFEY